MANENVRITEITENEYFFYMSVGSPLRTFENGKIIIRPDHSCWREEIYKEDGKYFAKRITKTTNTI
jgi:hypothetical protein